MKKKKKFLNYFFCSSNENRGKKKNIQRKDKTHPPIVPAAKGNQKASFPSPTIKGINPRIVETTVRKIGRIFEFHALVKARAGNNRGYLFLIALYSFRI